MDHHVSLPTRLDAGDRIIITVPRVGSDPAASGPRGDTATTSPPAEPPVPHRPSTPSGDDAAPDFHAQADARHLTMTHGQIGAARPQAQFDTQQQVNFPFKADEARYKEYGVYVTRDGRWWKRLVVHRTEPTKRNGLFYSRFWWPQTTRTEVGENYMAFAFGVLPNDHVERSANGFWFTIRDPHGSTKSPVPRDYVESDVRVVE